MADNNFEGGCSFGRDSRKLIRLTWAAVALVAALSVGQVAITLSAMASAQTAADETIREARVAEVGIARLEERLESIQKSLKRLENSRYDMQD